LIDPKSIIANAAINYGIEYAVKSMFPYSHSYHENDKDHIYSIDKSKFQEPNKIKFIPERSTGFYNA